MGTFSDLIQQIEQFIRKYYKNEMLKGLLLFSSIFLVTFLMVSGLEYIGRFGHTVRSVLFYAFLVVNGYVLINYIILPLFRLNKLGSRLSLSQASKMIGKIFPDVSDKLQNTLQLNAQLDNNKENIELIKASIDQRAATLSAIPFTSGIDLRENRKYLKYLLPILLLIIAIAIFRPGVFSDGSKRVINYSSTFVEPAPFEFNLLGKDSVLQGEAYNLQIELTGEDIPNEVKIVTNNGTYNLKKESTVVFGHQFSAVGDDIIFYCEANGFSSREFRVNVLQRPVISQVNVKLNFPKHTGMAAQEVNDMSEMTVPEGTLIEWDIVSDNTRKVKLLVGDSVESKLPGASNEFNFERQFLKSEAYSFLLSTNHIEDADTVLSRLTVIPDEYPGITLSETVDSSNSLITYFNGTIVDDYGFTGLKMVLKIIKKDSSYSATDKIDINRKNYCPGVRSCY